MFLSTTEDHSKRFNNLHRPCIFYRKYSNAFDCKPLSTVLFFSLCLISFGRSFNFIPVWFSDEVECAPYVYLSLRVVYSFAILSMIVGYGSHWSCNKPHKSSSFKFIALEFLHRTPFVEGKYDATRRKKCWKLQRFTW